MAYETKTKPTGASVADFLAAVENPARRADGQALRILFEEISGEPPVMWGPSIVGFGIKRYRYDSGHSGEICALGFSPRKANLVLYIPRGFAGADEKVARLGKVKSSAGCLYVNRLADIDLAVLRDLAAASLSADAQPAA